MKTSKLFVKVKSSDLLCDKSYAYPWSLIIVAPLCLERGEIQSLVSVWADNDSVIEPRVTLHRASVNRAAGVGDLLVDCHIPVFESTQGNRFAYG